MSIFGYVVIVAAVIASVLTLVHASLTWQRALAAIRVPPLLAGALIGSTATRGMYLLPHERVGIGLRAASSRSLRLPPRPRSMPSSGERQLG